MRHIKLALLLLPFLQIAVCVDHHSDVVDMFLCGQPQPKVFELQDILDQEVFKNITTMGFKDDVRPPVAILHRCHSTGYCKEGGRCMPTEQTLVKLKFSVWTSVVETLIVEAKNETACGCGEYKESKGKQLTG